MPISKTLGSFFFIFNLSLPVYTSKKMTQIRVARITKVSPHPHKNSLSLCEVHDGKESFQVVCGSAHLKEGMLTIFAGAGSTLPSGQTLQEVTIAGVNSPGMLCSAKDLGISHESGIINLPPNTTPGTPVEEVDITLLSSIPWHTYKEVDSLYRNPNGKLTITTGENPQKGELLSKTYFHNGEYFYRDFLRGKTC